MSINKPLSLSLQRRSLNLVSLCGVGLLLKVYIQLPSRKTNWRTLESHLTNYVRTPVHTRLPLAPTAGPGNKRHLRNAAASLRRRAEERGSYQSMKSGSTNQLPLGAEQNLSMNGSWKRKKL